MSFHLHEFTANLWKGVDKASVDMYQNGNFTVSIYVIVQKENSLAAQKNNQHNFWNMIQILDGPYHVQYRKFHSLRQEVRRFEVLFMMVSFKILPILQIETFKIRKEDLYDFRTKPDARKCWD